MPMSRICWQDSDLGACLNSGRQRSDQTMGEDRIERPPPTADRRRSAFKARATRARKSGTAALHPLRPFAAGTRPRRSRVPLQAPPATGLRSGTGYRRLEDLGKLNITAVTDLGTKHRFPRVIGPETCKTCYRRRRLAARHRGRLRAVRRADNQHYRRRSSCGPNPLEGPEVRISFPPPESL
jgi:hypothetical protein